MAELMATGPERLQRVRLPLLEGSPVLVGRAPRSGCTIPWDRMISREHAELELTDGQLHIRCLESARNPIYFGGEPVRDFVVEPGGTFQIGETYFQFIAFEAASERPSPLQEYTYTREQLSNFEFRNADQKMEALSHFPDLLARSPSNEELADRVVELLLEAIPHADSAAVVSLRDTNGAELSEPSTVAWRSRSSSRFRPSRRLISAAVERGHSFLHIWSDIGDQNAEFTVIGSLDWAFALPMRAESCEGWCIYVTGELNGAHGALNETDLRGDLRFTEFLAEFMGSILQVKMLEHRQAGFSKFFSPKVIETLRTSRADALLEPRESDITVLFCDVRGFSRKAEQARQNLRELLERVSEALGVMTCCIIKYDGVIADFQGDAALGFWGWPTAEPDGPLMACRAALEIQQQFLEAQDGPLAGFNVGIGIAHGPAIAGRIGTNEQIKVGAFGPVVNMGARLEGMTKQLRASILLDEAAADCVRQNLPASEGRCRQLARFRPAGMDTALMVSELLPPVDRYPAVSDNDIALYEKALESFLAGRWQEAVQGLSGLQATDHTKDYLMMHIMSNGYEAPAGWDGIISLSKK